MPASLLSLPRHLDQSIFLPDKLTAFIKNSDVELAWHFKQF